MEKWNWAAPLEILFEVTLKSPSPFYAAAVRSSPEVQIIKVRARTIKEKKKNLTYIFILAKQYSQLKHSSIIFWVGMRVTQNRLRSVDIQQILGCSPGVQPVSLGQAEGRLGPARNTRSLSFLASSGRLVAAPEACLICTDFSMPEPPSSFFL
jgi:hypothetical protein